MQLARPAYALDPRRFGRARARILDVVDAETRISDDFRLFATTFLAGFLFVSVLIG